MGISENIKSIREAKGIRQADVAKAIGVERTNYHRIENKGNKLTLEQLIGIAGALGVTLSELLGYPLPSYSEDISKQIEELEQENKRLKEELNRANRVIDSFTVMIRAGDGIEENTMRKLSKDFENDLEQTIEESNKRLGIKDV